MLAMKAGQASQSSLEPQETSYGVTTNSPLAATPAVTESCGNRADEIHEQSQFPPGGLIQDGFDARCWCFLLYSSPRSSYTGFFVHIYAFRGLELIDNEK